MKIRLLAAGLSMLVTTAVFDQPPPPAPSPEMQAARAAVNKACAGDTKALCSGKEGHEAMMCLRAATPDKVSAGCKDAMADLAKLAPRRP